MIRLNGKLFQAFIGRLSPRAKIVFYGAALLVFLFLFDRLLIHPILTKMGQLSEATREKVAQIKQDLAVLARRDAILAEVTQYKPLLGKANSEEEEVTILLKEIESLATDSAIYIVDMKPGGFHKEDLAKRYFVNLNCEAKLEELVGFMYHIENAEKMFSIDKLRVTAKRTRDLTTLTECSMLISKLIIP